MDEYYHLYEKYREFTMIHSDTYVRNLLLAEMAADIPGIVVECGTWRGGMIAGIAELLGDEREYYLFDSFEGLPPAREIDGPAAIAWQSNTQSPIYYDNCKAEPDWAKAAMQRSGVQQFHLVQGWFNETLPNFQPSQHIALLRLDADWYDSTCVCLESLYPYLNNGGIILIDDYYTWDGCSRAVHDFLSKIQSSARIRQFDGDVCYIVKP